jgi:hypothetical protein
MMQCDQGERANVVDKLFHDPFDLSSGKTDKIPYEEIFRSYFLTLTDLVANEATFISDFFLVDVDQVGRA